MLVVLTSDLYLVEWTLDEPPLLGQSIETDQGEKCVLKILGNDDDERGVPQWATVLRANLSLSSTAVPE